MRTAILTRTQTGDEGTFGRLITDNGFKCYTLELPWRDNARGISCAPAGVYLFKWRSDSPKHGACYEEWDDPATPQHEDVAGRDNIQIHGANLAGDESKGYVKQLNGCIALGSAIVRFRAKTRPAGDKDQLGLATSKSTTAAFEAAMGYQLFQLTIKEAYS